MLVQYIDCEECHRSIRIPDYSDVNATTSSLG
jgi:hypothetical protein